MKLLRMATRLARDRQRVRDAERDLAEARAAMITTALNEIKRGVSESRVARELRLSRATISKWTVRAGVKVRRQDRIEPLEE